MKAEQHLFFVKSHTPPTIEIDTAAASVYVRFKRAAVARTVAPPCKTMHVAVDLDSDGNVIGVEAVGITELTIQTVQTMLKNAAVKTPDIDWSQSRYVSAELAHA